MKSYQMPVAVICVGNLKAGGTGKTPFTLFLVKHYSEIYKTAILSRGYGRSTKGFILADKHTSSKDIGDEPLQIYQHAKGTYQVAVCEDRVEGVNQLLQRFPDLQLVILDDGFQHRKIQRDINILLTEQGDPFWKDYILPSGRLRESRSGAKRADIVVITKSDGLTDSSYAENIFSYAGKEIPAAVTGIEYLLLQNETGQKSPDKGTGIILVTGIANPHPLKEYIRLNASLLGNIRFKDHHIYSEADIQAIEAQRKAHDKAIVVTTEKDWVKIAPLLKNNEHAAQWYYLPIGLMLYTEERVLFSVMDQKITQKTQRLLK